MQSSEGLKSVVQMVTSALTGLGQTTQYQIIFKPTDATAQIGLWLVQAPTGSVTSVAACGTGTSWTDATSYSAGENRNLLGSCDANADPWMAIGSVGDSGPSSNNNIGMIIGAVVGGVLLVALLGMAVKHHRMLKTGYIPVVEPGV